MEFIKKSVLIRRALREDFFDVYRMIRALEEKKFAKSKMHTVYDANIVRPDVVYLIAEHKGTVV